MPEIGKEGNGIMRRKIAAVLLATASLVCLCACNKEENQSLAGNKTLTEQNGEAGEDLVTSQSADSGLESETEAESEEPASINLVMVGDMLMHERVLATGEQADGSLCYDHLFAQVKDRVENADIAIVNQETILGGSELGLSGYPRFNSPFELADAEAAAGFNVILQATNHVLDKGVDAVFSDMNYWEENYPDIAYLGINQSQEAQDDYLYVYEEDGIRVAILNYTYCINSGTTLPDEYSYMVDFMRTGNEEDKEKIVSDIARAHELADFVVVCPHWGTEYLETYDATQEAWVDLFLENGVDLVIGAHPHVIEPIEWYEDESGHEMLVYYSLGNFVNGTSATGDEVVDRMVGGMADVTIGYDEDGQVGILDYTVHPLVCHVAEGSQYTVYFLEDYTEELAGENQILAQCDAFSKEACQEVIDRVWGDLFAD